MNPARNVANKFAFQSSVPFRRLATRALRVVRGDGEWSLREGQPQTTDDRARLRVRVPPAGDVVPVDSCYRESSHFSEQDFNPVEFVDWCIVLKS